ncbi:unnamed protein product [Ectocarpus sp. 12 AP-2014]
MNCYRCRPGFYGGITSTERTTSDQRTPGTTTTGQRNSSGRSDTRIKASACHFSLLFVLRPSFFPVAPRSTTSGTHELKQATKRKRRYHRRHRALCGERDSRRALDAEQPSGIRALTYCCNRLIGVHRQTRQAQLNRPDNSQPRRTTVSQTNTTRPPKSPRTQPPARRHPRKSSFRSVAAAPSRPRRPSVLPPAVALPTHWRHPLSAIGRKNQRRHHHRDGVTGNHTHTQQRQQSSPTTRRLAGG